MMYIRRLTKLEPEVISLDHETLDPPAERLPEPIWINVTPEELKRMFPDV